MMRHIREFVEMLALALGFAFLFQTAAFATFYIPSESMVPTLQVGDRLTVAKYAYGWSRHSLPYDLTLPKTINGRLMAREPKRGDIVVFMHPKSGERMIKRLIGLPGDTISLRDGRLILNGKLVPRRLVRTFRYREYGGDIVPVREYAEVLPGGTAHAVLERLDRGIRRDMFEMTIPENRYFMMGDNRDNSADSRSPMMGLVPGENLVGRAEAILYTLNDCQPEPGTTCADPRFLTRLK